jgi:hypothetical protein
VNLFHFLVFFRDHCREFLFVLFKVLLEFLFFLLGLFELPFFAVEFFV